MAAKRHQRHKINAEYLSAHSSRREEAPTPKTAIEKSLVISAATKGQERILPSEHCNYSVACPTYSNMGISKNAGNVEALMSLAQQIGAGGQRPGEGMNLGWGEGERSQSQTNQLFGNYCSALF
jgi:hypothetical protein